MKQKLYFFRGYSQPRISPNTDINFYNIFLSNTPSWKDFSKRDMSLICTTAKNKAKTYGKLFYVIPYPTTKITVCPKDDIWNSFESLPEELNILNKVIYMICAYNIRGVDEYTFLDWGRTKKALAKISEFDRKKIKLMKPHIDVIDTIFNGQEKINFLDVLDDLLSPTKNGFKVEKYNLTISSKYKNREVFFEDSAILVPIQNLEPLQLLYKN